MKKAMKEKYEAVAQYAKETYETISKNQTISFKVNSIQAIAPNTFKIFFKCYNLIENRDTGFHEIVQYFTFSLEGYSIKAEPNYSYTNENEVMYLD